MKVIIISDIHANLTAFNAVLDDASNKYSPDAYISLGDLIDYGMRSNEIIERIQQIETPIIANLKGNHEKAIIDGNLQYFSSERGRIMSIYTKEHLSDKSFSYDLRHLSKLKRLRLRNYYGKREYHFLVPQHLEHVMIEGKNIFIVNQNEIIIDEIKYNKHPIKKRIIK